MMKSLYKIKDKKGNLINFCHHLLVDKFEYVTEAAKQLIAIDLRWFQSRSPLLKLMIIYLVGADITVTYIFWNSLFV